MEESEFSKLVELSRISCGEEEKRLFLDRLKAILSYVGQLKEVDTRGVPPCFTVLEAQSNMMREDLAEPSLNRELFLLNVPFSSEGMVLIPPILKK